MRIQQNELAEKLGWSPSDLNDILRGRKNIGKNRQAFLETKLGEPFRQALLLKLGEFSEIERRKPGAVLEHREAYATGTCNLSDMEQTYVDKLLAILRGLNRQAKLAIMLNIDVLVQCKKATQGGDDRYIKQLLKDMKG